MIGSRAWVADVAAIFLAVLAVSIVEHWVLPKLPGYDQSSQSSQGGVC